MTKADTKKQGLDVQEVLALREELDELNSRIDLAERKKSAVKPEIYRKVKSDYEAKLNKIINKLAKRSDVLRTEYERTTRREAKVKEKSSAAQDELEEIKFRFSLGEYSQQEHDKLSTEKMAALKTMGKEKASLEKSSQLLADILSRIDGAIEPKEEVAEVMAGEATTEMETEIKSAPEPDISEAPEPDISEAPETVPGDGPTQTPLDDIARELEAEMQDPHAAQPVTEQEVSLFGSEPEEAEPKLISGSGKEQELKCPKCSFENMADSWYCEKCGAELLQDSEGGGA